LGHGNSSTFSTFEKGGAKPFHRFAYDLWERFCGANSQIQVHLLESFGSATPVPLDLFQKVDKKVEKVYKYNSLYIYIWT